MLVSMRAAVVVVGFALVASAWPAALARADHQPVIVVPGRPDQPVIINGYDARGAIVEGDWGLYRPGQVSPTVTYGIPLITGPGAGGYYPSAGHRPRSGRYEIDPPHRRRIEPAQDFHRFWSGGSGDAPATILPPYGPPAVIVAPKPRRHRHVR